jgi:hypothetical protein
MKFMDALNGIATSSVRAERVIGGKVRRIAGGIGFFISNNFDENGEVISGTPSNVISVNGELTIDHINAGFKNVIENGGEVNAIRTSPDQAMRISKFENAKVNIQLVQGAGSNPTTVGGAVQVLESPIKVGNNKINAIYVDTRMAKDELEMFNDTKVKLIPKQNRGVASFEIKEPTADDDNYRAKLLGEWTAYFENVKENSYKMKKLSI